MSPSGAPALAKALELLGRTLWDQYWDAPRFDVLEETIAVTRQLMRQRGAASAGTGAWVRLPHCLRQSFEFTGNPADLQAAAQMCRQGLGGPRPRGKRRGVPAQQLPSHMAGRAPAGARTALRLMLGSVLIDAFLYGERVEDLEEAIRVLRETAEAAAGDQFVLAEVLVDLGHALLCRHERYDLMADLEEAIAVSRRALALTAGDEPRGRPLSNLGMALGLTLRTAATGPTSTRPSAATRRPLPANRPARSICHAT